MYTTSERPELVATIPTGELPHGLWPSGDGTRVYAGLENANGVAAIATATNKVVATIASGQSPQGMVYIPNVVPSGPGTDNLSALGAAGEAVQLTMGMAGVAEPATTVVVNNQVWSICCRLRSPAWSRRSLMGWRCRRTPTDREFWIRWRSS